MIPFLTTLFTNKPSTEGTTRNEKKPLDTADSKTASQSSKIKKEAPAESTPLSKRQATVQKDQARVPPQQWQQTVATHTGHAHLKQASTALPNRQVQTQTMQTRAATPEEQLQYQKDLKKFDEETLKNLASNLIECHKTFQSCYEEALRNLLYYKSAFEKNSNNFKQRAFLMNQIDILTNTLTNLKNETDLFINSIEGKKIDSNSKTEVEKGKLSPEKKQEMALSMHQSELIENACKFEKKVLPFISKTKKELGSIACKMVAIKTELDRPTKELLHSTNKNYWELKETRKDIITNFENQEENLKKGYDLIEKIEAAKLEEFMKKWNIPLMTREEIDAVIIAQEKAKSI